jgi:vacuolar-type H+-ATPase subunit I/STV1
VGYNIAFDVYSLSRCQNVQSETEKLRKKLASLEEQKSSDIELVTHLKAASMALDEQLQKMKNVLTTTNAEVEALMQVCSLDFKYDNSRIKIMPLAQSKTFQEVHWGYRLCRKGLAFLGTWKH